jgi:TolB-like protein
MCYFKVANASFPVYRILAASNQRGKKLRSLKKYAMAFLMCMVLLGAGCRGTAPTYHISEDMDFSFIKRVAVLPLDNLTKDRFAADIVRQVLISELLASGFVDVAIPGEVITAVKQQGIRNVSSLNAEQMKAMGDALGVQAVVFGSVERFGEVRSGNVSAPEVAVTLMMADTSSGEVIWSVTKTGGGTGFMARHFGAKPPTMSETVLKVVRDAVQTLAEY